MTKTALIIEDSVAQATLIGRMISAQPGWSYLHFPTFREGFEALAVYEVQAVFLDIFVGQHNALEHVSAYRKRSGSAPIVLMTAGSSQESVDRTLDRARKTRADFVLQKPFTEAHIRGIFAQSFLEPETVERRKTLLVIDDSKILRTFIRGVLEFAGYRVQDAESMDRAFRDVNIAHVDAVLCDVFMPGMGGLKGMRLIKMLCYYFGIFSFWECV
jgi:CheY-like chemotaxis protein